MEPSELNRITRGHQPSKRTTANVMFGALVRLEEKLLALQSIEQITKLVSDVEFFQSVGLN